MGQNGRSKRVKENMCMSALSVCVCRAVPVCPSTVRVRLSSRFQEHSSLDRALASSLYSLSLSMVPIVVMLLMLNTSTVFGP